MTREEIKTLLATLSLAYPTKKFENKKALVDMWEMYFKDYDSQIVFLAVKHYIPAHVFFPAIAEFKECVDKFNMMKKENIPAITGQTVPDNERGVGCSICPYDDFCQARGSYKCFV